ncbi:DNA repair and recombination protein RadA [Promethearchaeum syntrophicum]|uniref:DNA repair and recombination protein RadA n=1 Tax=Promethearchaeum syntrophicum TaxID=2594042 RepID=A0A5B9DF01_9ARCH|nr:DNA repair and recombination protein RadA [Candidatus Prometheoarchaeum syntrophicum]QEE17909.1 DNA repair and recombination protein RadA [Candidatus Prometheoarchaeum syntrophicum]
MATKKKKTSKAKATSKKKTTATKSKEKKDATDVEDDELFKELLEDEDEEDIKQKDTSDEESSEDEELAGMHTINYDIKDLPGIGATIAKKLMDVGYSTVNSIAITPARMLIEEAGLGDKTASKIIKAAREALNIGFKTADSVWERRKSLARINTSSTDLDNLLGGGGIETGGITEFYGEYRTGKTQLMHQLCVNVQLSKEEGGISGKALYIDTEGTFRPERLIQMAESKGLDYREILKNVIYARAYSSDHQIMLIKDAMKIIIDKNIKLIIVDSLISHFRAEFIGRGTLANRQQLLNLHIHDLLRLSEMYPELAVVITNQVQSKPDTFFGDPTKATGGNVMAHGATVRIYLRKGKGEQRVAKMIDAPNLPEGEAIFALTEGGIVDVDH